MNVAIVNFSGNVGKSTLCQYLLRPRIKADVFAVETINANEFDDNVEVLKGEHFKVLLSLIDSVENSIIDVGSSNVEEFFIQTKKLKAISEFDFFILPVSPALKQQIDTVNTIRFLLSQAVDKEKIIVVFNMVADIDDFDSDFKTLFDFSETVNGFSLNENLIISQNDFYSENKDSGKTIEEIVNDKRDFKKLIAEARKGNNELIPELSNARIMQLMAKGVKEELDNVFYEIFGVNKIGFDDE
jgi:hypothetical protein